MLRIDRPIRKAIQKERFDLDQVISSWFNLSSPHAHRVGAASLSNPRSLPAVIAAGLGYWHDAPIAGDHHETPFLRHRAVKGVLAAWARDEQ
jgi:hypothetical protein